MSVKGGLTLCLIPNDFYAKNHFYYNILLVLLFIEIYGCLFVVYYDCCFHTGRSTDLLIF